MHQAVRALGVIGIRAGVVVCMIVICMVVVMVRVSSSQNRMFRRMHVAQLSHHRLAHDAQCEQHQGTEAQQARGTVEEMRHPLSLRDTETMCQPRGVSPARSARSDSTVSQ